MDPKILLITVSGITIVFAVLLLLIFIFAAFGKVVSTMENNAKKKKQNKSISETDQLKTVSVKENKSEKPLVTKAVPKQEGIPEPVIAAIAAAVAVMSETDGKSYTIHSVRRQDRSGRPVWAMAGIMENTRPF